MEAAFDLVDKLFKAMFLSVTAIILLHVSSKSNFHHPVCDIRGIFYNCFSFASSQIVKLCQ